MTINLTVPTTFSTAELKPRISVIGVGGAGGNAVNNMIQMGLEGVEFIVANSDAQALAHSASERKIQMGIEVTKGLGAGSNPTIGRAAAEESLDEILTHLHDINMVFVTAGLGGGTGTGAAPVIAKVARDHGILTVGVVTKPFQFEGSNRMKIAEAGLEELQQFVDTLLIIPNQNLFRVANEKTTFADAFKMADDVLYSGVRGVTDLMVMPGLINLDFADIKSVMSEMGKAMMGTGEAEGERRAIEAAEAAIANPLLDDTSMSGAKGVLINITAGNDITLFEVDEAANRIRDEVAEEANIIFGSTFEESLEGSVRVSVVATGIEAMTSGQAKPRMYQVPDFNTQPEALPSTGAALNTPVEPVAVLPAEQKIGDEMPIETEQQDLIEHVSGETKESREPAMADTEFSNTGTDEVFIPAPPVDETGGSETTANPFAVADMVNARAEVRKEKTSVRRGLSLIERVTGVALGERKSQRNEGVMTSHQSLAKPSENSKTGDNHRLTTELGKAPKSGPEMPDQANGTSNAKAPDNTFKELAKEEPYTRPEPAVETTPESEQGLAEVAENKAPTLLEEVDTSRHLTGNEDGDDLLDIPAFLRRQAN